MHTHDLGEVGARQEEDEDESHERLGEYLTMSHTSTEESEEWSQDAKDNRQVKGEEEHIVESAREAPPLTDRHDGRQHEPCHDISHSCGRERQAPQVTMR